MQHFAERRSGCRGNRRREVASLYAKSRGLLYGITLVYFCSILRKGSPAYRLP